MFLHVQITGKPLFNGPCGKTSHLLFQRPRLKVSSTIKVFFYCGAFFLTTHLHPLFLTLSPWFSQNSPLFLSRSFLSSICPLPPLILSILTCHTANGYITAPQCTLTRESVAKTDCRDFNFTLARTRRAVSRGRQRKARVLRQKKWKEPLEWKIWREKCFEGELQMRGKMRKRWRLPVRAVEMSYKLRWCSGAES